MTKKSKIIMTIISILVLGVIGVSVFILLSRTAVPATNTASVIKSDGIVSEFDAKVADGTMLSHYSLVPLAKTTTATVIMADARLPKPLSVQTTHIATIGQADNQTLSDDAMKTITAEVKSYLEAKGLKTDTSISGVDSIVLRYTNDSTTCQLNKSIFVNTTTSALDMTLACADTDTYTDDVSLTNTLLDLWKNPSVTYSYLTLGTLSNDTYSVATVNPVNPTSTDPVVTLVFVKDVDWLFITDTSKGDQSLSDGKHIVNDDLKAAFDNPKYGAFLKDALTK
jgi:hypothetical protein